MMRALTLIAALTLTGCETMEPPAVRDGCDVKVDFGSYAMGVDGELKSRILAFVEGSDDVVDAAETSWGREGESTLCVLAAGASATDRVYGRIAGLIPVRSERAPTTVTHRDGRTKSSSLPPRS
ncbi:MAG TPA: hypothetical protein VGR32_08155 [Brevundimonas sp.]|jgi:hypothetical protein|uniref:hypothetical protein n=1 Tax=Brevundimonas sp. TaxID=1871086 RepID=UPI002DE55A7C|nr:hypothetical protein [Brevundimonas sp.]